MKYNQFSSSQWWWWEIFRATNLIQTLWLEGKTSQDGLIRGNERWDRQYSQAVLKIVCSMFHMLSMTIPYNVKYYIVQWSLQKPDPRNIDQRRKLKISKPNIYTGTCRFLHKPLPRLKTDSLYTRFVCDIWYMRMPNHFSPII